MTAPNTIDYPVTLDGRVANERRWVPWREETRNGSITKVPYSLDGHQHARTNNPADWGTRAEAEAGAHVLSVAAPGRKSGIGIILAARGAGFTPIGGIDLDTCFTEAGELKSWAADIVAALPSYCEISVSGTGLHVLFRYPAGDLKALTAALKEHGATHNQDSSEKHKPGISTYIQRGYFTVSGNKWPGSPDTIKEMAAPDLLHVINVLAPAVAGTKSRRKAPDESRSGAAWRLAVKTVAHGLGKRSFLNALYEDPDGAAWANENRPYNEDRAWDRASAKYGWMAELKRQKNGAPLSNLDNALQALRHAEDVAGMLGYDEMTRMEILLKPLPASNEAVPRPARDTDVTAIQEWLQENWLVSVSKDTVFQAVGLCAAERPFHPVRAYLKKLEWDGVDRLDSWLHTYFGVEQTPYTAAIGKMFLISMVARIFKPGCKVDYMVILEGVQGTEKSTVFAILADEWFSDGMPDIRDQRLASQHLDGKWLIEISELSAFNKSEASALKAFITRSHERYIKRYGRKEVIEPRQCVFVGTTNEPKYLRDATGGRRFWPVVTGAIDAEALKRDRDQLFAEAVARYQRGEHWWPDRDFEAEHIKPQQDARYEADPWEEAVRDYLSRKIETTVRDVATSALGLPDSALHSGTSKRITAILAREGFTSKHTEKGNRWIINL